MAREIYEDRLCGPRRSSPSGPLVALLMTLLMTLAAVTQSGCNRRPPPPDPARMFEPTGNEQVREMGIYSGGQRVGDMRVARVIGTWKRGESVVQLSESVTMNLSFRSDRFAVTSRQLSWVGEGLDLKGSVGTVDFGAGRWGTRVLKVGDNLYRRYQAASGSGSTDKVTVPEGIVLSDVLPLYLQEGRFREGKPVELNVFNMALDQEFPLTLEYLGRTPEGAHFRLSYWGMEENLWIDDSGMIVKEDMALGVSARMGEGDEETGSLPLETILSRAAVPGTDVPEDLAARESVVILMEGSFRRPPSGPWQKVESSGRAVRVRLTRPDIPPKEARLPDPSLLPRDDAGLNLDSPRIAGLSKKITGSYDDPWEKALAIGRWVYGELGKSMRECFSALQVLEAGEGECQSHSLLMVSLCRSAGIPARFAYGVVYLPGRGSFGFHTWVEVHVGEWIPVDPTLGRFPAGVDHLTLAVGSYRDQFRLFPYIMGKGGWRIKVQGPEPGAKVKNRDQRTTAGK